MKLIFAFIVMVALIFSGCGTTENNDSKSTLNSKTESHNSSIKAVLSSALSSESEESSSEPLITSVRQAQTSSAAVSSVATSKAQSSSKPPAAQPKTEPVQQSSTAPVSSASAASPYRKNCWGTPEMMENDLAVYAAEIGMQYDKNMTLEDGHWITPLSSWGAPNAANYKAKLQESIKHYQDSGYNKCRIIFEEHETLNAYLAHIVVD